MAEAPKRVAFAGDGFLSSFGGRLGGRNGLGNRIISYADCGGHGTKRSQLPEGGSSSSTQGATRAGSADVVHCRGRPELGGFGGASVSQFRV